MNKIFYIGIILLLGNLNLVAQIHVSATAPNVVSMDEQFYLVFQVNAQPSSFKAPDMSAFESYGPSQSSSTSIQIVNGKTTRSVNFSYTYVMQGKKPGTYTIQPATVMIGNQNYQSNAVTVEVTKGSGNSSSNSNQTPNYNSTKENKVDVKGKDLYVALILNKTQVYKGEQIIATIKIFANVNLTSVDIAKMPQFSGLWNQDIETPPLRRLERENVNGAIYNTGVLKRMVLIPERSGEIIIDPIELNTIVRTVIPARSFWDWEEYKDVEKKISSSPIKIISKPLPDGAPADFTGGVGSFKLESNIDKKSVKTNDAITLKIKISGSGNLKLFENPKINFPPDFEVYDPKIDLKIGNSVSGSSGSKTFEYIIIPKTAGDFKIPGFSFSYFDLNSKQYKTLSSEDFDIHVEKGAGEAANVIGTNQNQDLKVLASDIRHIRKDEPELNPIGENFYGGLGFYSIYFFMLTAFGSVVVIRRKQIKQAANIALVKNRRASKIVRKHLKEAAILVKSNAKDAFYDQILKGFWGYFGDKFNIPASLLNRENISEHLKSHQIENEKIQQLIQHIDDCEFAKYAPASGHYALEDVYKKSFDLINDIDQKLKV